MSAERESDLHNKLRTEAKRVREAASRLPLPDPREPHTLGWRATRLVLGVALAITSITIAIALVPGPGTGEMSGSALSPVSCPFSVPIESRADPTTDDSTEPLLLQSVSAIVAPFGGSVDLSSVAEDGRRAVELANNDQTAVFVVNAYVSTVADGSRVNPGDHLAAGVSEARVQWHDGSGRSPRELLEEAGCRFGFEPVSNVTAWFLDGRRWTVDLDPSPRVSIASAGGSALLYMNGTAIADVVIADDAPSFDFPWTGDGSLPELASRHSTADGTTVETWNVSPGECCATVTWFRLADKYVWFTSGDPIPDLERFVGGLNLAADSLVVGDERFSIADEHYTVTLRDPTAPEDQVATLVVESMCPSSATRCSEPPLATIDVPPTLRLSGLRINAVRASN